MKKTLSYCLIAMTIISACSKQKSDELSVDKQKVQEVISFEGDPGSRVVAFNILNPSEKAFAFKKHLTDSYGALDLNDAQLDFVKSIITQIEPEMYIKDLKDMYTGVIAAFAHQARELFSAKDYARLFYNIQPLKNSLSVKQMQLDDAPGDCYCKWQSTCQAYADTAGPYCVTGGCTSTSTGCGFLWLSECKGKCGRTPPGDEEEPL